MSRRFTFPSALLLIAIGLSIFAVPAFADHGEGNKDDQEQIPFNDLSGPSRAVEVVEISGLLDPVLTDMMIDTLSNIDPTQTLAIVFQVNSTGAVVSNEVLVDLADHILDAPVPISFWVGPSGSRATGPMAQLVGLSDDVGISPGARFGAMGESIFSENSNYQPFNLPIDTDLISETVGFNEAFERELARQSPVLPDHLFGIEGFEVVIDETADPPTVEPITQTRFKKLDVVKQFFHTVASPAVAYLLLIVGLGLLVFEFFTAGVGIAGVLGAGCFLFSTYGLYVLPTRWWGIFLLVLAFFAYSIDIQAGVPRTWTAIGTISLIFGSLFLFDGTPLSWITLVVGIVGAFAGMAAGMPAMVRTRFSSPTIGREWMIGETGEAIEPLSPNGLVKVRESVWRATTNRATPIEVGETIRVAGIDGLWLEVEPEEGAAKDYRDRSKNK